MLLKTITARETLELVSKQWCSSKEFSILSGTGKNTTLKLMSDLRSQLKQDNYHLPKTLLPMNKVVEYLHIDLQYLRKVSD